MAPYQPGHSGVCRSARRAAAGAVEVPVHLVRAVRQVGETGSGARIERLAKIPERDGHLQEPPVDRIVGTREGPASQPASLVHPAAIAVASQGRGDRVRLLNEDRVSVGPREGRSRGGRGAARGGRGRGLTPGIDIRGPTPRRRRPEQNVSGGGHQQDRRSTRQPRGPRPLAFLAEDDQEARGAVLAGVSVRRIPPSRPGSSVTTFRGRPFIGAQGTGPRPDR